MVKPRNPLSVSCSSAASLRRAAADPAEAEEGAHPHGITGHVRPRQQLAKPRGSRSTTGGAGEAISSRSLDGDEMAQGEPRDEQELPEVFVQLKYGASSG